MGSLPFEGGKGVFLECANIYPATALKFRLLSYFPIGLRLRDAHRNIDREFISFSYTLRIFSMYLFSLLLFLHIEIVYK